MAKTGPVHHLFVDDYEDRLERVWAAAMLAKDDKTQLLNGEDHPFDVLRKEYEELRAESNAAAEAADRAYQIRMVPGGEWREIIKQHPPRTEGDPDVVKADRLAGVNVETVDNDVLYAALVLPDFRDRDDRDGFATWIAETIGDGELKAMVQEAWSLANVARIDPKVLPSLPATKDAKN